MKWTRQQVNGFIGLYPSHNGLHLAAVRDDGDDVTIVSTAAGEGDAAALIARLDEDVRNWPVALTLPTQAGLHRAIDVPSADAAATQKMLALRLESLYPMQDTTLHWGWQRADEEPEAWVYLATGGAVDQHAPALPPASAPGAIVSREMALVAQVLRHDPRASLVMVTGADEHAAVTVLADGRLRGVEQADLEGDDDARVAALDEALGAATDAPRPARLLVAGSAAALAGKLAEQWRMQRVTLNELLGDADEGRAIAVGAAIAALRRTVPAVVFERDTQMPAEDRKRLRRRVIQAGAWLAAALIALAAVDLRNAAMLEDNQLDSVMSPDERAALGRERALAGYVQSLGPTPLAILDEIGQRTRNIQLDDITYDAGGDFRLRGKMRSTDTVNELVNALSKMQTLNKVSLVSQRRVGEQVEFEITAKPNRLFIAGFATASQAPAPEGGGADSPDNRQARRGGAPAQEATP